MYLLQLEPEPGQDAAQSIPSASAIAGDFGIASAGPSSTAFVGPGGIALALPNAEAAAGAGGMAISVPTSSAQAGIGGLAIAGGQGRRGFATGLCKPLSNLKNKL